MAADSKIQILLSTYNGEKYLREQLDSYLKLEGFKNIKVLIRDDGSSDSTPAILDQYHQKYGFEIVKGENLGVNGSMFELFRLSDRNCDYFALSDQDDVWLPHKMTLALSKLEQFDGTKPVMFASCSQIVDSNLNVLGKSIQPSKGASFYNALVQNIAPGHTQIFNRNMMQQLLEKGLGYISVVDWWIYLLSTGVGNIIFEKEITVLHRQHENNAVGYELNFIKKTLARLKKLNWNDANAISKQIKSFYDLYQDNMHETYREEAEAYLNGLSTFFSRICYVVNCKAYRQTDFETFLFKILYVIGKYNLKAGEVKNGSGS